MSGHSSSFLLCNSLDNFCFHGMISLLKQEHPHLQDEKELLDMGNTEHTWQPPDESTFASDWYLREKVRGQYLHKIGGPLPGGKWLTHPINVKIEEDDGEYLVSEPHFYIHASGATKTEAIEEFKRILSEELDLLSDDEKVLGPRLQAQLQYLRTIIGSV